MGIDIVSFRKLMADTLNRVAYRGERIVLTRHGRGTAALVTMEDLALLERLEDEADTRAARAALREKGEQPWARVKAELGLRGRGASRNGAKRLARRKTVKAKD